MSKYFKKEEFARCFRENGARCKECRLAQPAKQLPYGIEENLNALAEEVLEPVPEDFSTAAPVLSQDPLF